MSKSALYSNDKLVSWVQLLVLAALFAAYLPVSKGEHGPKVVPVALGLYALLLCARLVLSHGRGMPKWLSYLSAVLDAGIVVVFAGAVALAPGQPFGLHLNAPVFFLLFVSLAVQCRSLEPKLIFTSGLSAAVGWGYLVYRAGDRSLYGTQIEQIAALLSVMLLLWSAISRAKKLGAEPVVSREPESLAETPLEEKAIAPPAPSEEEPEAAIETHVEPKPEPQPKAETPKGAMRHAAVIAITGYDVRMRDAIEKHGGTIEKQGEMVLAHFGLRIESSASAADALRAIEECGAVADELLKRLKASDQKIRRGFAVAVGSLLLGARDLKKKLELKAIGDTATLALKLEKHNVRLGSRAITTRQALELAVAQGYSLESYVRALPKEAIEDLPYEVDLIVLAEAPEISAGAVPAKAA